VKEELLTHLDRHSCNVESMRKQNPFAQHSLVTRRELDFRDGKSMAQMQTTVHIRIGKVSKPFGVFLLDLFRGKASDVGCWWSIDLKELFRLPTCLGLFLEVLQVISLRCLEKRRSVIGRTSELEQILGPALSFAPCFG